MSDAWQRFHRQHHGALQQSWAYGEALRALGVEVVRVVATEGTQWQACAQFICRRFLGYISLASCARGPVFADSTSPEWRNGFFRAVRNSLPLRPLRVALFSPNSDESEWNALAVGGMHRVLTGYATSCIDLNLDEAQLRSDLEAKWRNRLVRAEANNAMKVFHQPSRHQLELLLSQEQAQRKSRGFFGLPTDFVQAYVQAHEKPAQAFRVVWAESERQTIAAMLFLLHGSGATYHVGWANDQGRDFNAHNLLLWRAMQELPLAGVQWLDTGGLNTRDLAGISRFKLGAGGRVVKLPGTYF